LNLATIILRVQCNLNNIWHFKMTWGCIYTISWFWNRSQKYRSSKSSSDFAIYLHGTSAAV